MISVDSKKPASESFGTPSITQSSYGSNTAMAALEAAIGGTFSSPVKQKQPIELYTPNNNGMQQFFVIDGDSKPAATEPSPPTKLLKDTRATCIQMQRIQLVENIETNRSEMEAHPEAEQARFVYNRLNNFDREVQRQMMEDLLNQYPQIDGTKAMRVLRKVPEPVLPNRDGRNQG